MKTFVISIMLSMTVFALSAQEVMQLGEARLYYTPVKMESNHQGDSYIFKIRENSSHEFAKDPIGFMKANFDIHKFINQVADKNYIEYEVAFKSSKGWLKADFDKKGNLLKTRQQFKDVALPSEIRNRVNSAYEGWTLTKTKYSARTKGEILVSAIYKVRIENGEEKQDLKIDARDSDIVVSVN